MMAALVERGLRAQLKSGNLITGELLVALDFHPESPPAKLDTSGEYPADPIGTDPARGPDRLDHRRTEPARGAAAARAGGRLRRTVQSIEAWSASPDTEQAVAALTESADPLAGAGRHARAAGSGPLLRQAESTLASAEALVGANSQLRYDAST